MFSLVVVSRRRWSLCWRGGEDGKRVRLDSVFAGQTWYGDEDVFVWFPALLHVVVAQDPSYLILGIDLPVCG